MAYIGKQPVVGNFVKLDAITTSATATYNLLNGGVAYFPQTANNCIVSLNGVIQSPTSAYTISGSTIVFDSALTSADSIDFILVLGDVLSIGTPSDGTVTNAKIAASTIDLTTKVTGTLPVANGGTGLAALGTSLQVLRTNTAATALEYATISTGAAAGQVIQVVQTTKVNTFSTTSSSYTDVTGLSVSITPSSASNKVLVLAQISSGGAWTAGRLLRNSTSILEGTSDGASRTEATYSGKGHSDAGIAMASVIYLDSPSTTSSTTYKIQILSPDNATVGINRSGLDDDVYYQLRTTSTITAMEIKG
jgi:hypothetical protein